ncbi:hypothetical protein [Streptococcus vestibularis]
MVWKLSKRCGMGMLLGFQIATAFWKQSRCHDCGTVWCCGCVVWCGGLRTG